MAVKGLDERILNVHAVLCNRMCPTKSTDPIDFIMCIYNIESRNVLKVI